MLPTHLIENVKCRMIKGIVPIHYGASNWINSQLGKETIDCVCVCGNCHIICSFRKCLLIVWMASAGNGFQQIAFQYIKLIQSNPINIRLLLLPLNFSERQSNAHTIIMKILFDKFNNDIINYGKTLCSYCLSLNAKDFHWGFMHER